MTGLLKKKLHVAILDNNNNGFISKMTNALKSLYSKKIIIKSYTDSVELFEAVNINQAKNKPFDVAILSTAEVAERYILQRGNPSLKIVVCNDEITLKTAILAV